MATWFRYYNRRGEGRGKQKAQPDGLGFRWGILVPTAGLEPAT